MKKWVIGAALALAALGASDYNAIRQRIFQPRAPRTFAREPF